MQRGAWGSVCNFAHRSRNLSTARCSCHDIFSRAKVFARGDRDKCLAKRVKTLAQQSNADPALLYRLLRAQAAIGPGEEDGSSLSVLTVERSAAPRSCTSAT